MAIEEIENKSNGQISQLPNQFKCHGHLMRKWQKWQKTNLFLQSGLFSFHQGLTVPMS